jgi:hypothetical protein
VQYSFKRKAPHYAVFMNEKNDVALKRDQLLYNYYQAILSITKNNSDSSYHRTKYLLETQLEVNKVKLYKAQTQLDRVQKTVDSFGTSIAEHPEMFDSLQKQVKAIADIQTTLDQVSRTLDSVELVNTNDRFSRSMNLQEALWPKLKKDYNSTILLLSLKKIKIVWFTLIGGFSRTAYTTYDPALQFSLQIAKDKQDALKGGIAINFLVQNKLKYRTLFLNASFVRERSNNLSMLSTTSIEQTRQLVNAGGDTTRVFNKKYSAYTDPVITYDAWNLTGNLYYLFGKTPFGFHFSPTLDFNKGRKAFTNVTAGYLISFQNTVKDQPVINTEFFVRFNDIFNHLDTDIKFWDRNEIGISFTIPFNIIN